MHHGHAVRRIGHDLALSYCASESISFNRRFHHILFDVSRTIADACGRHFVALFLVGNYAYGLGLASRRSDVPHRSVWMGGPVPDDELRFVLVVDSTPKSGLLCKIRSATDAYAELTGLDIRFDHIATKSELEEGRPAPWLQSIVDARCRLLGDEVAFPAGATANSGDCSRRAMYRLAAKRNLEASGNEIVEGFSRHQATASDGDSFAELLPQLRALERLCDCYLMRTGHYSPDPGARLDAIEALADAPRAFKAILRYRCGLGIESSIVNEIDLSWTALYSLWKEVGALPDCAEF